MKNGKDGLEAQNSQPWPNGERDSRKEFLRHQEGEARFLNYYQYSGWYRGGGIKVPSGVIDKKNEGGKDSARKTSAKRRAILNGRDPGKK